MIAVRSDDERAMTLRESEANRRRYEELRAAGQGETDARSLPAATALAGAAAPAAVIHDEETVPGGLVRHVRLRRGEACASSTSRQRGDRLADRLVRVGHRRSGINVADTMKVQWSAAHRKGRVVLTDMGRVALSLTEDTSGAHDAMGGSTPASMRAALRRRLAQHARELPRRRDPSSGSTGATFRPA